MANWQFALVSCHEIITFGCFSQTQYLKENNIIFIFLNWKRRQVHRFYSSFVSILFQSKQAWIPVTEDVKTLFKDALESLYKHFPPAFISNFKIEPFSQLQAVLGLILSRFTVRLFIICFFPLSHLLFLLTVPELKEIAKFYVFTQCLCSTKWCANHIFHVTFFESTSDIS